jgi:hypothetical protein
MRYYKRVSSTVSRFETPAYNLHTYLLTYILIYLFTYLLTELSPSCGAANCAATQKLPIIL